MNSRSWLNIVLFLFLVAAVTFFVNQKNSASDVKRLSSLKIDDITEIQISRTQGKSIKFKKNKFNVWYMTQPYQIKAHQFRINTLLSLTQTPVDKTYNSKDLELSQYALDPPRARITFNDIEFAFGKTNPINNKRYLLVQHKMSLLLDQAYPLISAQASSFIDLSLLLDDFDITKIKTPASNISRNKDLLWIATEENKLNADQIQSFLQHWRSAQAFAVHKYLVRKKLGTITINSDNKELIFEISDDDPWLILALPKLEIEYHLDKSMKNILLGIVAAEPNDA